MLQGRDPIVKKSFSDRIYVNIHHFDILTNPLHFVGLSTPIPSYAMHAVAPEKGPPAAVK